MHSIISPQPEDKTKEHYDSCFVLTSSPEPKDSLSDSYCHIKQAKAENSHILGS